MDIEKIRERIRNKPLRITAHASIEATKDGLSPYDIKFVIQNGKIIEDYPNREYPEAKRCLIYAMMPGQIPVHVLVDYSDPYETVIVTAYIPESDKWINFQIRKLKR